MRGTFVRLFPQSHGYDRPEIVELSVPAGSVGPGPEDRTLRTVLPTDKRNPYEPPVYMPPYTGPFFWPAKPDAVGDFAWIPVDAPQFLSQHLYGGVRRTLDCWERYLGRPVTWWHAAERPVMELVPLLDWNNAHSGPGFIETGVRRTSTGAERLFALNMDVIAHETAHAILFAEVGVPEVEALTPAYLALQESFSDLIALITALHFSTVVERMMKQTRGNLYVLNLVSRIGELSEVEQIRVADNETTLPDVIDLSIGPEGRWVDPSGLERTAHHLGQPMTGAIFDVLVDLYQDNLAAAGVLPPDADARGWDEAEVAAGFARLERQSGAALEVHGQTFQEALAGARDAVGVTMADTMLALDPDWLSFEEVAACMIRSASARGLPRVGPSFLENFLLRGIDPRPRLRRTARAPSSWPDASYRARRERMAALAALPRGPNNGEGAILAHKMIPHEHRQLE